MNKRRTPLRSLPLLLACALMILIGANSLLYFTRIDLTEDRAYSISSVSRNLFLEIEEQVHINYFLSNRLRSRAAEVEQISDLLYQYAAFSRGRITVTVADPTELGIAQDVEASGVLPSQIQVIEEDQQSVAIVYSGIVLAYLDRTHTIPFIVEPSTLEYELSSAIRSLIRDSERGISVLVGDERKNIDQDYPFISEQLAQLYEITSVFPGEEISQESSALIVLGARSLNRDDLYYVDQYLMNGGKILFAIDAVNVNIDLSFFASPVGALPIFELFDSYGFTIAQSLVADAYTLRIPLQRQTGGNIVVQELIEYPYWITLLSGSVDATHPITARFAGVDLFWASPIALNNENDPRVTPLLRSSPESWVVAEPPFFTNPQEAIGLPFFKNEEEAAEQLVGIVLQGEIPSAFSAPPQSVTEQNSDIAYVPRTPDGTIIAISDSDFPGVISQFTQSFHNFTFFQDAVSWLANDDDLLTIRTRANRDVRLNAVPPEQKSRLGQLALIINTVAIPAIVAIFGIIRAWVRRKQESFSVAQGSAPAKKDGSLTAKKEAKDTK